MDFKQTVIAIFLFLIILPHALHAEDKIDDLSFANAEITEVLKTISEIFQVTIVPDKTVQGNVTRYFKDTTLVETLTLLLEPLGYTWEIKEDIYFITKKPLFSVSYNMDTMTFSIDSKNGNLQEILDDMSTKSEETIIFNGNSGDRISIHIFNKTLFESLSLLTSGLQYELKKEKNAYYVTKSMDEDFTDLTTKTKRIKVDGTEDHITMQLVNQSTKDIVLVLFKKYKKRLNLISTTTSIIPYLDITGVTFDELLDIVLEHAGLAYSNIDGTYYIYNSLQSKQVNKYLVSKAYKLRNIDHKRFTLLIPPQILSPSAYKIDTASNLVIVYGSPDEVEYFINLIRQVDYGQSDYQNRVFVLKNIDVKEVKKYLPAKYQQMQISIIEDANLFSAYMTQDDFDELNRYFEAVDIAANKYIYHCKHLDPEEIIKTMLPPNIRKEQVVVNKNNSSLIFRIPEELEKQVEEYFFEIDVPKPVIRYQLLIVEYIKKNEFLFDWGGSWQTGTEMYSGNVGVFQGNSDQINANFHLPTIFGYYFTVEFAHKLKQNKAKVQMSTEVYGLSGENVVLTNTQTLQYRDDVTDNDTNTTTPIYSSTTFGLTLEIQGRATTDDQIFLEVSAKISDEIPSTDTDKAPDTSEKSVKNAIRTKSGKPIALGGLTSSKETQTNKILPGLGHIPYVGNAFKTHDNQYTDSEFVIYIIPFIQKTPEDLKKERLEMVASIYNYFIVDEPYGRQ
jgi:general secretion pathway protein D